MLKNYGIILTSGSGSRYGAGISSSSLKKTYIQQLPKAARQGKQSFACHTEIRK